MRAATSRFAVTTAVLLLAMTGPAPAQLDPLGAEFQVNTFTPGYQADADVAADAQGNFVTVWDGPATVSVARTVFVQRFDRNGGALGTEYEVPTGMCAPPRFAPAMCRNSTGGGALAWSTQGIAGLEGKVFAQLFDSAGNLLGTEFQVSSQPSSDSYEGDVSVACGDAGDFVVVWDSYGYDAFGITGRRFDSSGAPEGTEFQVNTYTSGYFFQPKVAADDDRDFVIVWNAGYAVDGSSTGIFGQRFASNGDFLGTEFQVNSYTMGSQRYGSVASNGAGDFVVAWDSSFSQDGSSDGIFGQRFASNGSFLGTEFQVNSYTNSDQRRPSVASDETGNFVIAWTGAYFQDGSGNGVFAQRFDDAGSLLGTEFQINTYTTRSQFKPSVAADDAGNFLVVWSSISQDGSVLGVFGQRFDSGGNEAGSEFQVNTFTAGGQSDYDVPADAACNGSGSCGATWQGPATTAPIDETVFLQLYDGAGAPSSPEVELAAGDCVPGPRNPAVCRASAGDFVVAWARYPGYGYYGPINGQPRGFVGPQQIDDGDQDGIFVQRFDGAGNPVGSEFQANTYTSHAQYRADVACDDAGNFVVVWTSEGGQDGQHDGVFGQRFTSGGAFVGTEFQINTYTTNDQDVATVAADMDGDFVVAWESYHQDGDGDGIFGRRFGSNGASLGTEFQVNTYTSSDQNQPMVSSDAAGNFVIAWESYRQDGDNDGVFAQRFGSNGAFLGTEFQVNTYTSGDNEDPAVAVDAQGDFVVSWEDNTSRNGPGEDVLGRRFDSAGTFLGTEFQVNSYTTGDQQNVRLAVSDDGARLVAVWESAGGGPRVAQRDGHGDEDGGPAAGEPSGPARAGGASPRLILITGRSQDGSDSGVFGQLYGPTDTPTVTPTTTPSTTPTETPTPVGPAVTGGDDAGSNEVTGTGAPNRDPGCLKVYEVGPNRVPDGGTGDDELLGSGGTDANGNFSIMLNRTLKAGDVIFIVDTCAVPPLSGPVDLITGAAPAPALSPALLALALAMLSLIALLGLRRRPHD